MASFMAASANPAYASLFPQAEDARLQVISKQPGEKQWPFAVDVGTLACVYVLGMKVVVFLPYSVTMPDEDFFDEFEKRDDALVVTTDPLQLLVANAKYFVRDMSIEDKIRRMGPYVSLGKKLCDQPEGAIVGPGEL